MLAYLSHSSSCYSQTAPVICHVGRCFDKGGALQVGGPEVQLRRCHPKQCRQKKYLMGLTSFTQSEERKWLITWHETISKPLRTYGDYQTKVFTTLIRPEKKIQLVHSLAHALTLTLTPTQTLYHLANKPQQTTSTLFRLMYPTKAHWVQQTINISTTGL